MAHKNLCYHLCSCCPFPYKLPSLKYIFPSGTSIMLLNRCFRMFFQSQEVGIYSILSFCLANAIIVSNFFFSFLITHFKSSLFGEILSDLYHIFPKFPSRVITINTTLFFNSLVFFFFLLDYI